MERKKIVAANWKMNLNNQEATLLVNELLSTMPLLASHQHVILCTPFTHLCLVKNIFDKSANSQLELGAQNCNNHIAGAYTGEISVPMLRENGVSHVIIGHSERRMYYKEDNQFLKEKVDLLISEKMNVIFCCGESIETRNAGNQNEFVAKQLQESLFHLTENDIANYVTIAYEPIWAIGTGVTASSEQAQEMHAFIRNTIRNKYNENTANSISLLYGGSCNASNAFELFKNPDIDGGLIGGASLKAATFLPIVEALQ